MERWPPPSRREQFTSCSGHRSSLRRNRSHAAVSIAYLKRAQYRNTTTKRNNQPQGERNHQTTTKHVGSPKNWPREIDTCLSDKGTKLCLVRQRPLFTRWKPRMSERRDGHFGPVLDSTGGATCRRYVRWATVTATPHSHWAHLWTRLNGLPSLPAFNEASKGDNAILDWLLSQRF